MLPALPAENSYDRIASTLADCGWSVTENFLPIAQIAALAAQLQNRWDQDAFHAAGVGAVPQVRAELRSDYVHWLEETAQTNAETPFFAALETLRLSINQNLFLGLFNFEGHMTLYPRGSFYRKHLDQFQGVAYRKVSVILYLNDDWTLKDGGALRLYLDAPIAAAGNINIEAPYIDVLPHSGTLACFLSDRFVHEVLPTQRERMSITGWFKVRI